MAGADLGGKLRSALHSIGFEITKLPSKYFRDIYSKKE